MKKSIAALLVFVLCFSVTACTSNEQKASAERIDVAQNAINALHMLGNGFDYDDLYLTENAEIHYNEWTTAYIIALEAFDALTSDEKLEIQNAYWLNEKDYYVREYEEILIEQEIALYCKDVAVENLKQRLVNKSSYEEYGWILEHSFYFTDKNEFWVELEIEYSATNKVGGRIDSTEYVTCRGTYQSGMITITSLR